MTGEEVFAIDGLATAVASGFAQGRELTVRAGDRQFRAIARIDTPQEVLYFQHGGILQYVLRQLLK